MHHFFLVKSQRRRTNGRKNVPQSIQKFENVVFFLFSQGRRTGSAKPVEQVGFSSFHFVHRQNSIFRLDRRC